MAGYLSQAIALEAEADQESSETLVALESITFAGKHLGVAETGTGRNRRLVLVRERTRKVGADGKRDAKNGTEVKAWRRTADVADFAHAVEAGLL